MVKPFAQVIDDHVVLFLHFFGYGNKGQNTGPFDDMEPKSKSYEIQIFNDLLPSIYAFVHQAGECPPEKHRPVKNISHPVKEYFHPAGYLERVIGGGKYYTIGI